MLVVFISSALEIGFILIFKYGSMVFKINDVLLDKHR